jgi:hypothetical protein
MLQVITRCKSVDGSIHLTSSVMKKSELFCVYLIAWWCDISAILYNYPVWASILLSFLYFLFYHLFITVLTLWSLYIDSQGLVWLLHWSALILYFENCPYWWYGCDAISPNFRLFTTISLCTINCVVIILLYALFSFLHSIPKSLANYPWDSGYGNWYHLCCPYTFRDLHWCHRNSSKLPMTSM